MQTHLRRTSLLALVVMSVHSADATTRYVWPGSSSPGSGYTNWTTAAHTIQEAVTVASAGDIVRVTNGAYATGGAIAPGYALTNRVCITAAVTVVSVNGPAATIIAGAAATGGGNGDSAVRGVYVGANAALIGFTITNGHTRTAGDASREMSGGGAWLETSGVLSNCVLTGNAASSRGGGGAYGTLWNCLVAGNAADSSGGVYGPATLYNCRLTRNTASWEGGGARNATLYNCTVASNTGDSGGGVYACAAENSIVYENSATTATNYDLSSTFAFSCTAPAPGGSNTGAAPLFVDPASDDYRLQGGSPCIDAGTNRSWMTGAVDLAGAPRLLNGRADIGAYEYYGPPTVDITNADWQVFGEVTNAAIGGTNNVFVTGTMTWTNSAGGSGAFPAATPWSISNISLAFGPNAITVQGMNPGGERASDTIVITRSFVHGGASMTHYAATNGGDIWPYTNWVTAARMLHNAANVAAAGDTVWVTNGVYDTGGSTYSFDGWQTNRVGIPAGVKVQSVNGPAVTYIVGKAGAGGGNGAGSIRCALIMESASLAGFTLTNGHTLSVAPYNSGGGALCVYEGTISNCLVTACTAAQGGGGVLGGGNVIRCTITGCSAPSGGGISGSFVYDSTLTGNSASDGGGIVGGALTGCLIASNAVTGAGGGAYGSVLSRCIVEGNTSASTGAGARDGSASNCIFRNNRATGFANSGGGACSVTMWNCAIYLNKAFNGAGTHGCSLYNCTVVANAADNTGGGSIYGSAANTLFAFNSAFSFADVYETTLTRCCAPRLLSADSGIESDPLLADYAHLGAGSPCIAAGQTGVTEPDIDGDTWAGAPSIGCDEFNASSATGALVVAISADYTNVAAGFAVSLAANIGGHALGHRWDFADGTQATNRLFTSHVWATPGVYPVVLRAWNTTFPGGLTATTTIGVVAQPVRFVNRANPTPNTPYTNWATAATNIQSAIDTCSIPGSLVWITNGTYASGRDASIAGWTTRIIVTNATTLRSVNGPAFTSIEGVGPNGPDGIRCAYLGPKSRLIGITLTNGHAYTETAQNGGGVYSEAGGMLSNCVIRNCSASSGGGAEGGLLHHCQLFLNTGNSYGAGAHASVLDNCAVWSNTGAWFGGGLYACEADNVTVWGNQANGQRGGAMDCTFRNSIIWGNHSDSHPNTDSSCDGIFSCVDPLLPGMGNTDQDPLLTAPGMGDFRLQKASPCIDAGTNLPWMQTAPDLAGIERIINGRVDMGALEYFGLPAVVITNPPPPVFGEVTAIAVGGTNNPYVTGSMWWTLTGLATSGTLDAASPWMVPNLGLVFGTNAFTIYGRNHGGAVTSATAFIFRRTEHGGASALHYVVPDGGGLWPYTNWTGAARNIQDALNAAMDGDVVLATNGVYDAGGAAIAGSLSNRVAITKAVTLRSVHGPTAASIMGAPAPGGGNGNGAVRCVYVGTNATLCGFTLTNGHTRAAGDAVREQRGGGAWCESSGVISNCVLAGNSASARGGAVAYGSLWNCLIVRNTSDGGGGAYGATLRNCTVEDNAATSDGGGASGCTLHNSIIGDNTPDNLFGCTVTYSCSSPLPPGAGNTNVAPLFKDRPNGNYRLADTSPCIDAGTAVDAPPNDLDGIPRPLDGNADGTNRVDMGAYELASASSDSDHDALDDAAEIGTGTDPLVPDSDYDGMLDGHETLAFTDPLDPQSFLGMLALSNTVSGTQQVNIARWWSVNGRHYTLKRSTNLVTDAAGFTVRSNIPGLGPMNVETDRPPTSLTPCFYYIRLE